MRHWTALTKFTEAGHLDASNNVAERCIRAVAVGRKAFLFVGSERAGHAAAIYYSLVESCKANRINPLTYLTYILSHARNKALQLPTPDEFAKLSAAPAGGCALEQSGVRSCVRQDAHYRTGSNNSFESDFGRFGLAILAVGDSVARPGGHFDHRVAQDGIRAM